MYRYFLVSRLMREPSTYGVGASGNRCRCCWGGRLVGQLRVEQLADHQRAGLLVAQLPVGLRVDLQLEEQPEEALAELLVERVEELFTLNQ